MEIKAYTEHINDFLETLGSTPKRQYEALIKMNQENSLYQGRIDYLLRNIKALADTETLDPVFRNMLNIFHNIGSKPIGIDQSAEVSKVNSNNGINNNN